MAANKLPENLAVAFELHVEREPDARALIIDERSWTRAQLAELAARATAMLLAHGVRSGDRIVMQYDTTAEDIAMALAAARLGVTLLPIPKRMGSREINYLLERSQAVLFAHAGALPPDGIIPPRGAVVRATDSIASASPMRTPVVRTSDEHIALIGVTSGSTGQPKAVMHGWTGVAWAAERMRALANVQSGETVLVTGAGAGAPGFTFFTYLGMAHGVTIVRASRWDPRLVLELAHEHCCVWSVMVTTMLQMLLQVRAEVLGDGRLQHMRAITVGGSFMSPSLIRQARAELGVEVLRMYAMAECMAHSSMLLTDDDADRDVLDGRPGPDAELAIFDETRQRVSIGTVGEIGIKGPSLLKGYLADADGKAWSMTDDGFLLSGDLGKVDARGYVRVVGRKKDMIIRGGFNIDPTEVEELIRRHPDVAKVVVVGYPDKIFGERACAVVEPHPGCAIELKTLIEFLLGLGLSKEKLPERLEVRTALPLSPDGKILKAQVRSEIGTNPAAGLL